MFRLDFRMPHAPALRDIDWNAAIARAQQALQKGQDLEEAVDRLQQDVNSFLEQMKTQAGQLLQQIASVRTAAATQASLYAEVESDYFEDDAPPELVELYEGANTGDYEYDLDSLAEQLESLAG